MTWTISFQAKAGFGMNIIAILVVTLGINTWGYSYYDLGTFPDWARATIPTLAPTIVTTTGLIFYKNYF